MFNFSNVAEAEAGFLTKYRQYIANLHPVFSYDSAAFSISVKTVARKHSSESPILTKYGNKSSTLFKLSLLIQVA